MTEACFHCGLPVPAGLRLTVPIDGAQQPMCCRGCQAVAQTIVDYGLSDYYRHRTALPQSGQQLLPPELGALSLYDRDEVQKSFVAFDHDTREAALILENISCAACLWLNERHLQQLPGVISAQVNYATQRARIRWNDGAIKLSEILLEIQKLGYNAHPFNAEARDAMRKRSRRAELRRIAVAGICAAQIMMLAVALYAGAAYGMDAATRQLLRWVSAALSLPVLSYAAWPFYRGAWFALRQRRVNMDVPVVIAIVIAFVGSVWNITVQTGTVYFDTLTMFVLFLLSARYFERAARDKSVQASENLLQMTPTVAARVTSDGSEVVAIGELRVNDVIIVGAGAPVAADGAIMSGETEIDESLLTGESRPIVKKPGDRVVAGTMNLISTISVRVSATGDDTVLSGVVRLLDRAQAEKPASVALADRVASWFIAAILVFALVVTALWFALAPQRSFEVLLAVLVVTCPCALSLAAPAAFAAAGSRLLQRGILLTRGHTLESLPSIDHVVFDKTGTLTQGTPKLAKMEALEGSREQNLRLAAALEQHVSHPFARALTQAAGIDSLPPVERHAYAPGEGVSGWVAGVSYFLGRRSALPLPRVADGGSVIGLYRDAMPLAWFYFSDTLRPEAASLVAALRQRGINVSIASGDSAPAVRAIAEALNVTDYRAGLTPQDKLAYLRELQAGGRKVMMIGDGINDAAVLAGADVSIAIGNATDIARAASDIVLLAPSLRAIEEALDTGKKTRIIIRQNFVWAIAYNLVMLPLAALGMVAPWLAALGMSTSSFVVVMNALRLRQGELPTPPD